MNRVICCWIMMEFQHTFFKDCGKMTSVSCPWVRIVVPLAPRSSSSHSGKSSTKRWNWKEIYWPGPDIYPGVLLSLVAIVRQFLRGVPWTFFFFLRIFFPNGPIFTLLAPGCLIRSTKNTLLQWNSTYFIVLHTIETILLLDS